MKYNVAIDGPAGAGKSTVAKLVADKLNLTYIDTGAMYRAITLKAIEKNTRDLEEIIDIVKNSDISIEGRKIFLDGRDVTDEIRSKEVSNKVSELAKIPEVRHYMVKLQQNLAKKGNVIMDGRDIATTVLPDAEYKFYLTADLKERAKRRYEEIIKKGQKAKLEQIEQDILKRDLQDSKRSCSPLKVAEDAIIIDTTNMTIDEVAAKIISYIKEGKSDVV